MKDDAKNPISFRTYSKIALCLAGLAFVVRRLWRSDRGGPPSARDIHVTPEPMPTYGH